MSELLFSNLARLFFQTVLSKIFVLQQKMFGFITSLPLLRHCLYYVIAFIASLVENKRTAAWAMRACIFI